MQQNAQQSMSVQQNARQGLLSKARPPEQVQPIEDSAVLSLTTVTSKQQISKGSRNLSHSL